ncbi:MAG: FG-GAP-like repeat-containing protein [Bacteroidota bacterium]
MKNLFSLSIFIFSFFLLPSSFLLAQEYFTDANTVLLLHCNETSGTTAYDSSGNANNGTATGTTIVDGKFGKARSFNGTSDKIVVSDATSLDLSSAFTVEAWIKLNSIPSGSQTYNIIDKGSSGNRNYLLAIRQFISGQPTGFSLATNNSGGEINLNPDFPLVTSQFYHIALVADGSNLKFYVNGKQIASTVAIGPYSNFGDMGIGFRPIQSDGFFHGLIDEIRISNIARQPSEFNVINVASTSPTQNVLNVSKSSNISVTFTKDVNQSTVTSTSFIAYGSVNGRHLGAISFSDSKTALLNPTTDFKEGEVVTVNLTNAILSTTNDTLTYGYHFSFTVDVSTGNGKFVETATLPTYVQPTSITSADFDADGDIDLAVTNYGSGGTGTLIKIYKNSGIGVFTDTATVTVGNAPRGITHGDIDNDGDEDLIVANNLGNSVSVVTNNGSGSFTETTVISIGNLTNDVAVDDMNGDGALDILVSIASTSSVLVYANNGTGGFPSSQSVSCGSTPDAITTGDFDGDGDIDFVVLNTGASSRTIALNNGNGTFATSTSNIGNVLWGITNGDFDGDSDIDFMITSTNENLAVLSPNAAGVFTTGSNFATGITPRELASSDFDNDNDLDIIIANEGSNSVSVLKNNGSGSFTGSTISINGTGPRALTVADLDGDGDLDFAVTNITSNIVSILKNINAKVTAISPAQNALNVSPSANVEVTFNTALTTSSLNDTTSFIVSGSVSGRHRGSFSFSGGNTVATFNPTNDFKNGEVVTVNVSSNVKDNTNTSVQSFVSQFTIMNVASTGKFATEEIYATGYGPNSLFVSDIDGDGDGDIAVANLYDDTLSILINNGNGTFDDRVSYTTGTQPHTIFISDIDGDGDGDLIVANEQAASVSIFKNNGNGTLAAKVDYITGGQPQVFVSDVDGDGDGDIVTSNFTSNSVSILMNNGDGIFAVKVDFTTGGNPESPFICDIDNDGDNDIATSNWSGNSISILKNNGDGTFATKIDYPAGNNPTGMYFSDIDSDGDADIAVASYGDNLISVFKNNGDGSFATKVDYITDSAPVKTFLTDIDGDGDNDLIGALPEDSSVAIYKNTGNGTFEPKVNYLQDKAPICLSVVDIDNDGDGDVVTTYNPGYVSILKNINAKVTAISPTQNALNVAPSANVQVTFNTALTTSSLNDTSSFIVSGSVSGRHRGSFAFSGGNTIATFNPTIDFKNGEVVTVNVSSNVKDVTNTSVQSFESGFTIASTTSSGTFATKLDYGTGTNPFSVFISDIDNDGDGDIVLANNTDSVSILKNNGNGTFATKVDYEAGNQTQSVFVSDIDGINNGDVITANYLASTISVLKNNGDGTFATKTDYVTGTNPQSVFVGDIDGDGDGDAITANYNANTISVLKNNGNGTFGTKVDYATGSSPFSVILNDIDDDGDADAVVTNHLSNTISILTNNGDGTFATKVDYATGVNPFFVTFSDIDGDGDGDAVVANQSSNTISVLKNNGNGTFATKVDYTTGSEPMSVYVSDFDGDGDGDVVVTNLQSNTISVFKNNGNGTFGAKEDYSTGVYPHCVSTGDIDGDGDGDVVVSNYTSNTISILKNINAKVNTISPTQNALAVSPSANVQVTFNTALTTSSLNDTTSFIVSGSVSGRHRGSFAFSGGNTIATFNPTTDFKNGEVVTVNVSSNVKDNTNTSVQSFVSQFTIANTTSTGTFATKVDYGTANRPSSVFISDLDGDGDADIVVGYDDATISYISVYKNNGDGTYAAKVDYGTGTNPISVFVSDIDGDGDGDITVVSNNIGNISVLKNNGDGTFAAKIDYASGSNNVFVSDIDGDGDNDIAATNFGANRVSIMKNNGDGTFAQEVDYPIFNAVALFISDLDGDGDGDLAVTNFTGVVSILKNNGDGTFATNVNYGTGAQPYSVYISDIDNDGDGDMVVANSSTSSSSVSVLKNNGNGTFASKVDYPTGSNPYSVFISDIDGDGDGDIVTACGSAGDSIVSVLKNNGNGTFATKIDYTIGDVAISVFFADVDNDGDGDIVTANSYSNTISILKNINNNTLVAYYPFSGNANDGSGYGNNGTVNGATITSDRFGNANSAYSFDGVNDKIGTNKKVLNTTGNFSIEAWIKLDSLNKQQGIISEVGEGNIGEYQLVVEFNNKIGFIRQNGAQWSVLRSNQIVQANKNYNITAVYDGSLQLYINGAAISATLTNENNGVSGITETIIGDGNVAGDYPFSGIIDDIRIYNRALDSTEIDSLYHLGGWPIANSSVSGQVYNDMNGNGAKDNGEPGLLGWKIKLEQTALLAKQQHEKKEIRYSKSQRQVSGTYAGETEVQKQVPLDGGISEGEKFNAMFDSTLTDEDGNYAFTSLIAGIYTLTQEHQNDWLQTYPISNGANFIGLGENIDMTGIDFGNTYTNGLVAYYPFNNNTDDESGYENNGANNGATITTDRFGNENSAYSFDGNDYVRVFTGVIPSLNNFSVSCWANAEFTNEFREILSQGNTGNAFYLGHTSSGMLRIGDNWQETSISYPFNSWHHFIVVKGNDSTYFYLDGMKYGSTSLISNPLQNPAFTIGRQWNEDEYWLGSIDDIRIYNRALSAGEIDSLYHLGGWDPLSNGLVASYPFNNNANDESGNGNNGTVNGATITTDRFGNANSSYHFNGVDNYIQVDNLPMMNIYLTYSAWIKIDLGSTQGGNFGSYGLLNNVCCSTWDFGYNPSAPYFAIWDEINNEWYVNSPYSSSWQHAVFVYNNNTRALYLNGTFISSQTITPLTSTGTNKYFRIGIHTSSMTQQFLGNIDDIRIYNRALSAGEIDSLYREGGWTDAMPEFSVVPSALSFGNVAITASKTDSLLITNTGTDTLKIDSVYCSDGNFSVSDTAISLAPDEQLQCYITFSPIAVGVKSGSIIVLHNADGSPASIAVSGVGIANGTMSGMVFSDVNGNGQKDESETGLSGWVVKIVGAISDSFVTSSGGNYTFTDLPNGSYNVSEVQQTGYVQTSPSSGSYQLRITANEIFTNKNFGNTPPAIIIITAPPDSILSWTDSTIWSNNQVPADSDFVVIPESITVELDMDEISAENDTIGSLSVAESGHLRIRGGQKIHINGHLLVKGNCEIEENDTPTFEVGGDVEFDGNFIPGHSTIVATAEREQHIRAGVFHDLHIGGNPFEKNNFGAHINSEPPKVFTDGNVSVSNTLRVNANLDAEDDTLFIINDAPNAIAGEGIVTKGTIQRAIQQGAMEKYQFENEKTYLKFDGTGTYPAKMTMTIFPDSLEEEFSNQWKVMLGTVNTTTNVVSTDSVTKFSRWTIGIPRKQRYTIGIPRGYRFAHISNDGGENFRAELALRYEDAELMSGTNEDSLVLLRHSEITFERDTNMFRTFSVSTDLSGKPNKLKPKKGAGAVLPSVGNWRDTVLTRLDAKNGMVLGLEQSNKDSAKKYGWIRFKKGADMAKFYTTVQTNSTYNAPFDSLRYIGLSKKPKQFIKELKPSVKTYTNPLVQAFGVFKLNLYSSMHGVTPTGLDSLTYINEESMWHGMTLPKIANTVDSIMTFYKRKLLPNGDTAKRGIVSLEILRDMLNEVNDAFTAPIVLANGDSLETNVGLQFTGMVRLDSIPFLARLPNLKIEQLNTVAMNWEEPEEFTLEQNYPNPFNPQTAIGFSLLAVGNVTLKIYDMLGREVVTLLNNNVLEAGEHEIQFDASGLSSGVYFYRMVINGGEFAKMKKLMLLK